MANGKKRTTFAKLNREAAVRERRQIKEARKAARKLEASMPAVAVVDDEFADDVDVDDATDESQPDEEQS